MKNKLIIGLIAAGIAVIFLAFWLEQPQSFEQQITHSSISRDLRPKENHAQLKSETNPFADVVSDFPDSEGLFKSLSYPEWWADQLRTGTHQEAQCLLNLLQIHRSISSRKHLRAAWKQYRKEITLLWTEGYSGAESLFFVETGNISDRYFASWVAEALTDESLEDTDSFLHILLCQSAPIRSRMADPAQRVRMREASRRLSQPDAALNVAREIARFV
jgi:hypothetical protein